MKKPLKVIIIGGNARPGATSLYDDTWEVWGLNAMYRRVAARRWHRMFNLHRFAHLERDCPEYVDWDATWSRRNPKVPIYVIDSWKGLLKNQVIFPRVDLAYQPYSHYHASSFDWMVAYAIHLKAELIHVHGCGFALDSPRHEPISGRACLEFWLGYAEGRGIKTAIADSDILRQYHLVASNTVYGYDDVTMVENRTGHRMPRIG